ncbi:MAG TPA: Plug domain-containing protein, partial [Bacteroidales bacterium]|nr:Plug domain-containing protein [Bacteroidales bacterium]
MRRKGSLLLLISLVVAMNALSQQPTYQEADSTIRLSEVIVNAYQVNTRQHQLPGSISLLTAEEMERGDSNSFAHALHAMPGIYMHSGTYATSRIVIRGVGSRTPYNTNRIKAYLNDIPITSSDGISTPEDIDLTGIARMEVIKGPASALYGSGLGGNINLYTPQTGR